MTGVDAKAYRRILGHYPTGVCVVTAMGEDGKPTGMAVGSFTSVSLDPPLVGFFPDKGSSSWPRIAASGRFCVNVLAADQEWLCRRFAMRGEEKFSDVGYRLSINGQPVLDDVVAWIDCKLHGTLDAGDHYLALGSVEAMETERGAAPLLFLQGRYGTFVSAAVAS